MGYKDSYKIVKKTHNIILAFSHTLLGSSRDEIALKRLQGQGGGLSISFGHSNVV